MAFKASKFRNVRGQAYRTDNQYPNLNVTNATTDGPIIAASALWASVLFQSNTQGTIGILNLAEWGQNKKWPTISAHSAQINDMQWNPFHPWMLATAASDGNLRLWKLPENGLESDITADQAAATLTGHGKRVDTLAWHPSAVNVLASTGADNTVRLWDAAAAQEKLKLDGIWKDQIDSISWNYEGSALAVAGRDKKLRIVDPRSGTATATTDSHKGTGKPQKVIYLGKKDRLLTTGYSQMRDREFWIWDSRDLSKPLKTQTIDSAPGCLTPLYDTDTDILYMSARGDSTIRVFEISEEAPHWQELTPVVDKTPHRGFCMLPKLNCDIMQAEIARLLKVTNTTVIPIGFSVPRKSYRDFHGDLFPDTASSDPALSADEWFAGQTKPPVLTAVKPPDGAQYASDAPASSSSTPVARSPSTSQPSSAPSSQPLTPAVNRSRGMSTVEPAPKPVARPHAISVSGTVTPQEDDEYYVPKDISIVRTSHFRHIFGKVANRVDCYEDLKIHNEAMQNRLLRANKTWFGVSWQGVGGRLGVFNFATDKGRVAPPIQKGKTEADQTRVSTIEVGSAILDFDFHPFKDDVLATGSENAQIRVWKIPSGGIKNLGKNMTDSELTLKGHNHKIVSLDFHPFASNLLLTTSGDLTAKLWDVQAGNELQTLKGFGDLVTSTTWNYDGSVLGTACKDRTVRLFDPRANQVVFECPDVGGTLGSKVEWLGNKDQLAIVGFDKGSERHIQLIDIKKGPQRLADYRIDTSAGVLTPIYDQGTGVLALWGKGETSVKFFEINDQQPLIHPLTEYQSTIPQLGFVILPKHLVDVREVEVFKAVKLTQDTVEPISFKVPRQRKEFFQDDVYPPTPAQEPTCTATEWLAGSKAQPKLIDLRPSNMQPLSEAPKIIRMVKKFKVDDSVDMDPKAVQDRLVDKFYAQVKDQQEDEFEKAPGDDNSGAESDEWDD